MHTAFFIPPEFADLPPEMDVNYMRGRENIKKNAKAALKQILENPDYQFVADHASFLGRIQTACMRIRPDEVTGRVGKLQEAVEKMIFQECGVMQMRIRSLRRQPSAGQKWNQR